MYYVFLSITVFLLASVDSIKLLPTTLITNEQLKFDSNVKFNENFRVQKFYAIGVIRILYDHTQIRSSVNDKIYKTTSGQMNRLFSSR